MKKTILIAAASLVVALTTEAAFAQTRDTTKRDTTKKNTTATVQATGDVVQTLSSNPNYSTAALAAKAANLEASLSGAGPYTIFAPDNAAFTKLASGKLDSLMKDTTKLLTILKHHIVNGKYGKSEIVSALKAGKGTTSLTSIDGQSIKISITPKHTLQITDAAGNVADVVLYDLVATNGIVNGIGTLLVQGANGNTTQ
jgi:uncharacterized surface protein with fasciclin (FAS1) repeats